MAEHRICSVPDCGKPLKARGFCSMHYERLRKHGDPLVVVGTPPGEPEKFLAETVIPFDNVDCLAWPYSRNAKGYGTIKRNGRPKYIHRLVCEARHGSPPTARHEVAHSCGNAICCNPAHLRWSTRKENEADKLVHGTVPRGGHHWCAKLTERKVKQILALRGTKTRQDIAGQFGVSLSTIKAIYQRRYWRHVSRPET